MDKNDILNRPFNDVYNELMKDVGVSSTGRTNARKWICRNTTKLSGRTEYNDTFSTVKDFLDDFHNRSYSSRQGYRPFNQNYVYIFARKLKEMINEIPKPSKEDEIQYAKKRVSRDALYTQLAEECIELAHAALKMARVQRDGDPSIDPNATLDNLKEEFNDVLVVYDILGFDTNGDPGLMDAKIDRWYTRLLIQESEGEF